MIGLHVETVQIVGGGAFLAGVSESRPSQAAQQPGETKQRVTLLLPSGERLNPPTRVLVRGLTLRVLGTQAPPIPGEPSLVSCQAVHPDLPDGAVIFRLEKQFDQGTNRYTDVEQVLWAGEVHAASRDPRMSETAGEIAPLDVATITLPVDATFEMDEAWVRIVSATQPHMQGWVGKIAGSVLDSTTPLRRVMAYSKGVI